MNPMSEFTPPSSAQIRPKIKGKSDFFSWRLYLYVKRYEKYHAQRTIWAHLNPCTGSTALYIGSERDGDWIHAQLLRGLCTTTGKVQRLAFGAVHGTREWVDITEQFWSDYLKKGVCAIHGDYAHQWIESESERVCEYCKKREVKRVVMMPVTQWVD